MKDNYTYPAIMSENEVGGMDIIFPDFNNATTCAAKGEDAVEAAQDFLVLMIADAEDNGRELPQPGKSKYMVENGLSLVYINVWMPYHRTKIKEVYVKKTLTIPVWLDMLAKENNINFSATLVKGLKEELGLTRESYRKQFISPVHIATGKEVEYEELSDFRLAGDGKAD